MSLSSLDVAGRRVCMELVPAIFLGGLVSLPRGPWVGLRRRRGMILHFLM